MRSGQLNHERRNRAQRSWDAADDRKDTRLLLSTIGNDSISRQHRRRCDEELLQELIAYGEERAHPRRLERAKATLAWLRQVPERLLGGSVREYWEYCCGRLHAGQTLEPPKDQPVRKRTTMANLDRMRGAATRALDRELVAQSAPWTENPALLPKKPPNRIPKDGE